MKSNKQPLVSVIMPAYNASRYLVAAINSILDQNYKNFELIIVDDASTDSTWEIISQFKAKFPKKINVKRLRKNRNKGGDEAGNVAFAMAKGEFIARMDADDIAHPDRLQKQVNYLQKHPKVTLVGSSANIINGQDIKVGEKIMPTSHKAIFNEYFTFHPLIHPTLMIRKSALKNKSKLYRIEMPSNNDYLTFFSMINEGHKFANLPAKLIDYRMHGMNDSLSNVKKTFKNTIKIRKLMIKRYGFQPSFVSKLKSFAQSIIVGILPDIVVFNIYMFMRKNYSITQIASNIINNWLNTAKDFLSVFQQQVITSFKR